MPCSGTRKQTGTRAKVTDDCKACAWQPSKAIPVTKDYKCKECGAAVYQPVSYGLSCAISSEWFAESELGDALMQPIADIQRMLTLRTEVEMGAGLSSRDAKFLLELYDEARNGLAKLAKDRPAPTVLTTIRRWLAEKIAPQPKPDEYDD